MRPKFYFLMLMSLLYSLNIAFIAFIVNQLIGIATETNQANILSVVLLGSLGLLFFLGIGAASEYLKHSYIQDVNISLKSNFVAKYTTTLPVESQKTFNVTSFLTSDMKLLEKNGILAEITIFQNIMIFIVAISASIFIDIWTTLSFFLGTFLAAFVSVIRQGKTEQLSEEWSANTNNFVRNIEDIFSNRITIQIYDRSLYFISRLRNNITLVDRSLLKLNFNIELNNQLVYIFAMIFGIFIPFGVGIYRVTEGYLLLAGFMAVLQLSNSLVNPLLLIIQLLNEHSASTSIIKKYDLMTKLNHYKKQRIDDFNSINFHTIIKGKSVKLSIKKGDRVLIRGDSGIGKSTILNGLLYNPQENTYSIDNNSIKKNVIVQGLYSYVNQNGAIFNDSFYSNITLGADFSLDEVKEAINISGLSAFEESHGFDYIIEKDGGNISGGEAQRIRIARALLQDNEILVLDEITSSLDSDTAYKIRNSIFSSSKTIIEVAHYIDERSLQKYNKIINLS